MSRDRYIIPVNIEEYTDIDKCWIGSSGYVDGILVLSDAWDGVVPNLVSIKCYVDDNGKDYTVSEYISAMSILDDGGNLKRSGISNKNFIPNYIIDLSEDWDGASIFAVRLELSTSRVEEMPESRFFRIKSIKEFSKLDIRFSELVNASPTERLNLFCSEINC